MNRPNSNSIFISEFWNLAFLVNTYNVGTTWSKSWRFRFSNILSYTRLGMFYGSLNIYYTDLGFFHVIEKIEDKRNNFNFILNDLGYIEITDLKEYTIQEFKELYQFQRLKGVGSEQQHQFNDDLSRNINGSYY